jgi:acyl carrier protein
MTRFRYDVLLRVGGGVEPEVELSWLDWKRERLSLEAVRSMLGRGPEIVGVTGVPNARLWAEVEMVRWLKSQDEPETVAELLEVLSNRSSMGVDPEEMWSLGQEMSYAVDISWSSLGGPGSYDVVFSRRLKEQAQWPRKVRPANRGVKEQSRALSEYANVPLQNQGTSTLIPQLRSLLKERLPDYMVPAHFVLLERLPLTPNGKVNRRALPAPDTTDILRDRAITPPSTPIEEQVVSIFSTLLGQERVGVDESFFALGGHSLLGTQVIMWIAETFGVDIPLRTLFDAPTARQLSAEIERLLVELMETMSDEDIRFLLEKEQMA